MSQSTVAPARLVTLALLAGVALLLSACTTTQLNAQWLNPQAGARLPVRNILVIGISRDTTARRVYEDAMVAQLATRGIKAQPSYRSLPDDGPAAQPAIEKAVRDVGADSVLISRTVSVTNEVRVSPGMVMGPPYGFGWGGFYGYYHGMWSSAYAIPPERLHGAERGRRHPPVRREGLHGAVVRLVDHDPGQQHADDHRGLRDDHS